MAWLCIVYLVIGVILASIQDRQYLKMKQDPLWALLTQDVSLGKRLFIALVVVLFWLPALIKRLL